MLLSIREHQSTKSFRCAVMRTSSCIHRMLRTLPDVRVLLRLPLRSQLLPQAISLFCCVVLF